MFRPISASGSQLFVHHRIYAGISSFYLTEANTTHSGVSRYPQIKARSVQAVLKPVKTGFTLNQKGQKKQQSSANNNRQRLNQPPGNFDLYL